MRNFFKNSFDSANKYFDKKIMRPARQIYYDFGWQTMGNGFSWLWYSKAGSLFFVGLTGYFLFSKEPKFNFGFVNWFQEVLSNISLNWALVEFESKTKCIESVKNEPLILTITKTTAELSAGGLNYFHSKLSDQVKHHLVLYSPLIAALAPLPVQLGMEYMKNSSGNPIERLQSSHQMIESFFKQGESLLHQENDYLAAARSFETASQIFVSTYGATLSNYSGLSLTSILYEEALCRFLMRHLTHPYQNYAMELLDQILDLNKHDTAALQLKGIIQLLQGEIESAKKTLALSYQLDNTQTDSKILLSYLSREYKDVKHIAYLSYSQKKCLRNRTDHIILEKHAKCLLNMVDLKTSNIENICFLIKSAELLEMAYLQTPFDMAWKGDRHSYARLLIDTLIKLRGLIQKNDNSFCFFYHNNIYKFPPDILRYAIKLQSQKGQKSEISNQSPNLESNNEVVETQPELFENETLINREGISMKIIKLCNQDDIWEAIATSGNSKLYFESIAQCDTESDHPAIFNTGMGLG